MGTVTLRLRDHFYKYNKADHQVATDQLLRVKFAFVYCMLTWKFKWVYTLRHLLLIHLNSTLRLKDLCKSYKRWSDLVRKRLWKTSRAIIFLRANLESISCHATCKRVKLKILITGVEIHYRLPPYKLLSPICLRWLADSRSTFVHVNGPVVRLLFSNLHTSCPIRIVSRVGNKNNDKTTSTRNHLSSFGDTVLEIHVNYN